MFSPIVHLYSHAFSAALHFLCSPFMVSAAIDTGKTLVVCTVILATLMTYPRTRRATVTIMRFVNRHSPAWAKPLLIAAAFFPGQADEILLVGILLFPILRNARNRRAFMRSVRYAWHG